MESMQAQDATVDAVFALSGSALLRDHAWPLQQALIAIWPWLLSDVGAGVHPLKLVPGVGREVLLSGRTRLIVRAQSHRYEALAGAVGSQVDVEGHTLQLGSTHQRVLQPHATLYAYRVASTCTDESEFMEVVQAELADLGIAGERVCGKRQSLQMDDREVTTFSMMLHGLVPEQSLRLQQRGLGPHRLLGCGLFVPHKSAAAVGV